MTGDLLFNIGLVAMGIAIAGGLIVSVLLGKSHKQINKKLDAEYGKRRH